MMTLWLKVGVHDAASAMAGRAATAARVKTRRSIVKEELSAGTDHSNKKHG